MATRAAVDSTRKASCFFTFFRIAKPSKQKNLQRRERYRERYQKPAKPGILGQKNTWLCIFMPGVSL